MTMSVQMNMTQAEKQAVENYLALSSLSLAEIVKQALFEKMEDDEDARWADEVYREYLESGEKGHPIKELWKELGYEV